MTERRAPIPLEAEIQAAFVEWADHQPFSVGSLRGKIGQWLYAVPNGELRPWQRDGNGVRFSPVSQKLRRMGQRAGVPDVCLAIPSGPHGALYIEFKRPGVKATLSSRQAEWFARLELAGYRCVVVDRLEDAVATVRGYLARRRSNGQLRSGRRGSGTR